MARPKVRKMRNFVGLDLQAHFESLQCLECLRISKTGFSALFLFRWSLLDDVKGCGLPIGRWQSRTLASSNSGKQFRKMGVDEPSNPFEKLDASASADSKIISLREGTENFYTGSEPFFSFFTQAQVILSTIRLTLEHRVIVPTSDLSSQMEGARRGFQHSGNLIVVVQDVGRIAAQFKQRAQQWEREIQNREQNKSSMSGALIQRLKAEATQVRSRIQGIDRALIKLEVMLHQMAGEAKD